MKKLLGIVVLGLLWCNVGYSNSINDIETSGYIIGESALKKFEEDTILKNKKNWYKNKEITPVQIPLNNNPDYDVISFSYRTNDPEYKILEITLMKNYPNNFENCFKRKDELVNIFDSSLSNLEKKSFDAPHPADKSGKSKTYNTKYTFDDGAIIFIACYDWSEETGKVDHYRNGLLSSEFAIWVRTAHK